MLWSMKIVQKTIFLPKWIVMKKICLLLWLFNEFSWGKWNICLIVVVDLATCITSTTIFDLESSVYIQRHKDLGKYIETLKQKVAKLMEDMRGATCM